MKTVEVIISKDGAVVVFAHGFKGTSCEKATDFLNDLFKKIKVDYKESYYEVEMENIIVNPLPSGHCG